MQKQLQCSSRVSLLLAYELKVSMLLADQPDRSRQLLLLLLLIVAAAAAAARTAAGPA
jgi:hypothetical protein